jgi:hypothetical protein
MPMSITHRRISPAVAISAPTCPGPFDGCVYVASTELAVFGPAAGS